MMVQSPEWHKGDFTVDIMQKQTIINSEITTLLLLLFIYLPS